MRREAYPVLPPFRLRSSRRRYCRAASFSSRRLLRRSSSSSALMCCAACSDAAVSSEGQIWLHARTQPEAEIVHGLSQPVPGWAWLQQHD